MSLKSYLKLLGNVTQHKTAARTVNMTPETNTLFSAFIKDCEQPYVPENIKILFKGVDNPYVDRFYSRKGVLSVDGKMITKFEKGEIDEYLEDGFLFFRKQKKNEEKLSFGRRIKKNISEFLIKKFEEIEQKRIVQFKENLAAGKYNSNQIEYVSSSTTMEAVEKLKNNGFSKRVFGVKKDNPRDLYLLNLINEALCDIHNATNGRSFMPRKIRIVDSKKSADGLTAAAAYSSTGTLTVCRNAFIEKEVIYHEIGHANHTLNVDLKTFGLRYGEHRARGQHDVQLTYNFDNEDEIQVLIEKYMGEYAKTPAEFAAEHFKCAMLGIPLPKQLHQANEALQGFDWSKTSHQLLVSA